MNRNVLARLIGRWVAAAAPLVLSGCPDPLGGCPTHLHTQVAASSAGDGGGAGDGGAGDCHTVCRDSLMLASYQDVISCGPITNDGGEAAIDCEITVPCTGRQPAGLASSGEPAGGDAVGRHFARMAHLEEASVSAFRDLGEELVEHGAPRPLVDAARAAAREEQRHTRMAASLARLFGAAPRRAVLGSRRARSLEALAAENAVEGCVRETYGAAAASWQAHHARSRRIRRTMERIALDEAGHAALAWSIARWADRHLDPPARARVDAARDAAAKALSRDLATVTPPALVAVGVPPAPVALSLLAALRSDLSI